MVNPPTLSIVTPTRGNFSEYWFEQLCAVQGNVEFVLVYPPGSVPRAIADPRFKIVVSPFKGEVIQRFTGLINASGEYLLALDDDDYIHPDVVRLITEYFQAFPESWCLRLMVKKLSFKDEVQIKQPWEAIPAIHQLTVKKKGRKDEMALREVPIAPLTNRFDPRFLVGPYVKRRDMHGPHIENFNNKVWRADRVKPALEDFADVMNLHNALTWIPRWSLDRTLGLFIQAKFFEENKVVGHWMPLPEQIRYIEMPQTLKKEFRLILPSDALLVKRFSQYGYFWNLFFEQFWIAVKRIGQSWLSLSKG